MALEAPKRTETDDHWGSDTSSNMAQQTATGGPTACESDNKQLHREFPGATANATSLSKDGPRWSPKRLSDRRQKQPRRTTNSRGDIEAGRAFSPAAS